MWPFRTKQRDESSIEGFPYIERLIPQKYAEEFGNGGDRSLLLEMRNEISDWLLENCEAHVVFYMQDREVSTEVKFLIFFKHEADATLYKLTWL